MNIQWFPGHMQKSLRDMRANLKGVDFVLYVLDSRSPYACINPVFDELFNDKKVAFVLNKADLAPQVLIDRFKHSMAHKLVVVLDSTMSKSAKSLVPIITQLCQDKLNKYKDKGVKIGLVGLVVGVPNVGKSTIINNLAQSKKTTTANIAGVTRSVHSIKINDYLSLLDTPGTLYPKLNNQDIAIKLALLGCINDQVLDITELSRHLLKHLNAYYPQIIFDRYGIDSSDNFDSCINKIALKRGYLLNGGILDTEKAAIAILDDFRKGKLGKVGLE